MAIPPQLPEFLWGGWGDDEFLFAVHKQKVGGRLDRSNPPLRKADALGKLRDGWCFFGLCPRISSGQSKEHCSPEFDVVWSEIDMESGISAEEALEVAVSRCEGCQLRLYPSAITFSGNRSPHIFFKLDNPLPCTEIEACNRKLAILLGGDRSVINIDRCIRHPGTVHEKSGKLGEILDFSANVTPVDRMLAALGPLRQLQPRTQGDCRRVSGRTMWSGERRRAAEELGDWRERDIACIEMLTLPQHLAYIRDMPPHGWSDHRYQSRSEIEQGIVGTLVRSGASDRQIIEFADYHLAKHIEKRGSEGDRYIERMIDAARDRLYDQFGKVTSPKGGSPRKRDAQHRWRSGTSYRAALELAQDQSVTAWIKQVVAAGIATQRTAYRIRDRLQKNALITIDECGCVHRM